jgi:hypothetical protein
MFFIQSSFLNLMLYAEIIWIFLYVLSITLGVINDNILLTSMSFYLLAFAGVEFSFGFLISIYLFLLRKNINNL